MVLEETNFRGEERFGVSVGMDDMSFKVDECSSVEKAMTAAGIGGWDWHIILGYQRYR